MEYVKILFSILVTMPILALGGWLFLHYCEAVVAKHGTRDTDKHGTRDTDKHGTRDTDKKRR